MPLTERHGCYSCEWQPDLTRRKSPDAQAQEHTTTGHATWSRSTPDAPTNDDSRTRNGYAYPSRIQAPTAEGEHPVSDAPTTATTFPCSECTGSFAATELAPHMRAAHGVGSNADEPAIGVNRRRHIEQLLNVEARMLALGARGAALRADLTREAREEYRRTGTAPTWRASGLGTVSFPEPVDKRAVVDEPAFASWAAERYPAEYAATINGVPADYLPAVVELLDALAAEDGTVVYTGVTLTPRNPKWLQAFLDTDCAVLGDDVVAPSGEVVDGARLVKGDPDGKNVSVRLDTLAKKRAAAIAESPDAAGILDGPVDDLVVTIDRAREMREAVEADRRISAAFEAVPAPDSAGTVRDDEPHPDEVTDTDPGEPDEPTDAESHSFGPVVDDAPRVADSEVVPPSAIAPSYTDADVEHADDGTVPLAAGLAALTVPQLRERCIAENIGSTGKKADLVSRLTAHYSTRKA